MPKNILTRGHSRSLTRNHRIALAGVGTLGAAALAFSTVPADHTTATSEAAPAVKVAYSSEQIKGVKPSVTDQLAGAGEKVAAIDAKMQADAEAE
ncbi:lytic transglycosylase, partial [Streptomyces sp. TRM76130]|nr:lytic transglycosylase [Streptomyces sp. TRM76130]